MKKIITLFLLYPLIWAFTAYAGIEAGNDDLEDAINYLLTYVKNSDCIFIRNDKEHTAKDAVAHMQRKYEHFKDEIKSPEDFIRLTASKSLMTGKPYMIKTTDGMKLKSENWLLKALELFRAERMQQQADNAATIQPQ
jgi:hypothetical protein